MKKRKAHKDISPLGGMILFFRELEEKIARMRIPQKLMERHKREAGCLDEVYTEESRISLGFGIARSCAITLLCILLAVTLLFGGRIISYESVYYMFKDIGYISSFNESRPSSLNYSRPVSNQSFAAFKNGLAVAGDSEIKLFTSTGRMTLTEGSAFSNPKLTCSDSYALIYDQGRHSFSVYNSFISVYSETLKYPISSADMAKDGSFCIVTRSEGYGSVVRVYDKNFSLEAEYSKNDYVVSAELSDDGKHLCVLSFDAENGESVARLSILRRGSEKLRASAVIYGVKPYFASFFSGDRIVALCDRSAVVYDLGGTVKNVFDYPGTLTHLSLTEGGVALLFDEESVKPESILVFLDHNGNLKRSQQLSGIIGDMACGGGYVYLLCEDEAVRYDTAFGFKSSTPFSEEDARLVTFDNGEVMACTDATAYYLTFD